MSARPPLSPTDVGLLTYGNIPNPICIVDEDGAIVALNPSAERFWATTIEEVGGQVVTEALRLQPLAPAPAVEPDGVQTWAALRGGFRGGAWLHCVTVGRDGQLRTVAAVGVTVRHQGSDYTVLIGGVGPQPGADQVLPDWALTDTTTGLGNRAFWERAAATLRRASGVVAFADVDSLKEVNDRFGHRAGDRHLAAAGAALRAELPAGGIAARYGGDEFLAALPGLSLQQAQVWSRRVDARLAAGGDSPCAVRLSWGLAEFAPDRLPEAVEAADEHMYVCKGTVLKTRRGSRLVLSEGGRRQLREGGLAEAGTGRPASSGGRGSARAVGDRPGSDPWCTVDQALAFVAFAAPEPDSAVVEVGAGTGRVALDGRLAERVGPGGQLLLTDPSAARLAQARRRARQQGHEWIRFLQAPAHALPLGPACADLVLGACFLHHCRPPRLAVREMARVLRPGGRLAMAVVLEFPPSRLLERVLEPARLALSAQGLPLRPCFDLRPGDAVRLCESAGLVVERSEVVPAGRIEFPDREAVADFVARADVLGPTLGDLLPEEQELVQDAVLQGIPEAFAATDAADRCVAAQVEHVLARRPD